MPDKHYDIGVVGEADAVLAFRAIGMRACPAETPEQISAAVFKMVKEGVPVIFITESAAEKAPETLKRYQSDPAVSIIPIPGSQGTDGFGMKNVKANVEKAIGADILFNNDEK